MDLSSSALGSGFGSSGLGSGLGGGSGDGKLSASDKTKLINTLKARLAQEKFQELLEGSNDKCFKLCITKPGSSLSSSDNKCLQSCVDRYFDSYNTIAKAYGSRLQKELGGALSKH